MDKEQLENDIVETYMRITNDLKMLKETMAELKLDEQSRHDVMYSIVKETLEATDEKMSEGEFGIIRAHRVPNDSHAAEIYYSGSMKRSLAHLALGDDQGIDPREELSKRLHETIAELTQRIDKEVIN